MRESDLPEFTAMLDAVCGLLSRGNYQPNDIATAMFFRALAEHPMGAVRAAFDGHVKDPKRGQFVPTPADIIAQLQAAQNDDGHLGAEEAWAVAVLAADERETVVWTSEIAEAWNTAKVVFALGDEVGARMAFKEAYQRLIGESRSKRIAPTWMASLGHDPERRTVQLGMAVTSGRLPAPVAAALLPPPDAGGASMPDAVREMLMQIRDRLTVTAEAISPDSAAKTATQKAQAEAARRVDEYINGAHRS